MTTLYLHWPPYRLLPYERLLAIEEAAAVLSPRQIVDGAECVTVKDARSSAASRLTYFSAYHAPRTPLSPTIQHLIETGTSGCTRRQSTRYSVHGLHEYKGKFNPQVARALLNAAGLAKNALVLDPFCGSGTTLVECAHAGFRALGTDINPLATMITNAKAEALVCAPDILVDEAEAALRAARGSRRGHSSSGMRGEYLRRWFEQPMLERLETLRTQLLARGERVSGILLTIASNLLREFSLQEPEDLRIRRRKSPQSERDPYDVFLEETRAVAASVRVAQRHAAIATDKPVRAHRVDIRTFAASEVGKGLTGNVDAAITSPPYAMALPYIDTQRLSLVWLGLVEPSTLPILQAELIGSREFNGSPRSAWEARLRDNVDGLPSGHAALCRGLLGNIDAGDGFRRRAVPSLLYRYLAGMRDSFRTVRSLLKPGAPFFLIVGHNHSVLGGRRVNIDTPTLLAELGATVGLAAERREALQTYQRFGLHQKNAISREELLTLRAV
jgi:putative RNA methylase family UPF0020